MNWEKKAFVLGEPPVTISWRADKYQGETSDPEGYTSDWTGPEDSDSLSSYLVEPFLDAIEDDFGFPESVPESGIITTEEADPDGPLQELLETDKALGESNTLLNAEWVRKQVTGGDLMTVPSEQSLPWADSRLSQEVDEADKIKPVVLPDDYEKVEVGEGMSFFLGKNLTAAERGEYVSLLREFSDVFPRSPSDLSGIPPELGDTE